MFEKTLTANKKAAAIFLSIQKNRDRGFLGTYDNRKRVNFTPKMNESINERITRRARESARIYLQDYRRNVTQVKCVTRKKLKTSAKR